MSSAADAPPDARKGQGRRGRGAAGRRRGRGRPLAWSILALVAAAVLLATLALFAVTFSGPPPREAPVALDDVAAALAAPVGRYRVPDRGPPRPGMFELPRGARDGMPPPPPPLPRLPPFAPPRMAPQFLYVTREAAVPLPRRGERADAAWAALLAARLGQPADAVRVHAGPQPPGLRRLLVGGVTAAVRLDAGGRGGAGSGWLVARTPDQPLLTRWHLVTLGMMGATLAVLLAAAWAMSRAVARPLERLATAAQQARAGFASPPFPTDGPTEVRALTAAVSDMHDRLQRHADGRSAMLAAMAHDLGTPLSRLAFRAEQLPEAERARAAADVDEMRAMIAAAIGFARGESGSAAVRRVDLASLLETLADDMRSGGQDVTVTAGERAVISGDPAALRRLFANLAENAVRYGRRARIGWTRRTGAVAVTVADDGPGIDPATAERLFEPFVRGDPSRNRGTGGTGLGLAIARSVAERHGGTVTLENAGAAGGGGGGAVARVVLPA